MQDETWYKFVRVSGNQKTGPMAVTFSGSNTCPDSCPLKNRGCYASLGYVAMVWRKVDSRKLGYDFKSLLRDISSLYKGELWRHNVAGDLPGESDKIDTKSLMQLARASKGRRGFTYTHKPVSARSPKMEVVVESNRKVIHKVNKTTDFTINLSANNVKQADEYMKLGIAPVVTILPEDTIKSFKTPGGHMVKVCPHYTKGIQCHVCKLCYDKNRKSIIGFPVHGAQRNKIEKLASIGI
jgi:hypothetical protein